MTVIMVPIIADETSTRNPARIHGRTAQYVRTGAGSTFTCTGKRGPGSYGSIVL